MKTLITALALFSALLLAGTAYGGNTVRYQVIDLGNPLGGTGIPSGAGNVGNSINNRGWIAGEADLPGNTAMHAELWLYGFPINLGTLGGPNSAVAWPNHNDHGLIVGISDTAALQPLGESWSCALAVFDPLLNPGTPDRHVCVGFVWQNGKMTALPTLGGVNGFATGVNNRGQIVGWSETTFHDPSCNANNQVLQFLPVVWEKQYGHYVAKALPLYPDDMDGTVNAINQKGQMVGISGLCGGAIGGESAEHMVMWHHGQVVHVLPTLHGHYWNTPMDINNRGNVVGFSDLPGDSVTNLNFHAFFWSPRVHMCSNGETTPENSCDLGTLSGDVLSEALGINNRNQVVGASYGSTSYGQAFIYENGQMINLNDCVVQGTTLFLTDAQEINNRGVITGQAYDPGSNVIKAFVAIPVPDPNGNSLCQR